MKKIIGFVLLLMLGGVIAYNGFAKHTSAGGENNVQSSELSHSKTFSPLLLVSDARKQIGVTLNYDPAYTRLPYPNGDVSQVKGVCTDVVIRAMRLQGVDLQQKVHDDMSRAFSKYPTRWGLKKPDANIDHRRVLNLEVFMSRRGASLPLSDFQAGDWVTWRVGDKNLPHIGLVSNQKAADGTPLIIHNIGAGTQEEDVLHAFKMVRHYRWR